MKLFLLPLLFLFFLPLTSKAQTAPNSDLPEDDNGELIESILKLTETPDYAQPQREFALETIRQFEEEAASPDFSPLEFEKKASDLIDMLVEQYQFISADLIMRHAYQILLPYYNDVDISKFYLYYLATSVSDFYISAKIYYKAISWIEVTTRFCMNTGRDYGDHWIRNLFNSIPLFVNFNQIDLAKEVFFDTLKEFLAAKDNDDFSPYTVKALIRAAYSLIEHVDVDSFSSLIEYLNSAEDLSLDNLARASIFRAKCLTHYYKNYQNAFKLYKRLLDSPVFYIGFQEALGDMMETAWMVDKDEYQTLMLMAVHLGRDLIQLTINSFSPNDSELFWQSAAEQLNHGFGINLNNDQCSQFEFQGIFLNAVFTKALSVINHKDVIDLVKEQGPETSKALVDDILELRHRMANTTDKELRDKYDGDLENMEVALRSSMDLSWLAGRQNHDAMFMPRLLKDGECEVEIVEYPCLRDGELDKSYGAIICTSELSTDKHFGITSPMEHYEFVPLGPSLAWQLLYNGLENNLTDRDRANQYNEDVILSVRHLFSPLFQYFREHDMKKAFISPTGILNMINIGALPWGEGDSIVNDKVEIVRINAAYDVKDIIKRDSKLNSAVVFSNIDYSNVNPDNNVSQNSLGNTPSEISGYRVSVEKGNNLKKFPRLPIDGKRLSESIRKSTQSINHYSGADANENIFKRLNGKSPDLIHIDTHGFFIPEGNQAYLGKHVVRGTRESALLTCGLAMSGANKAWSGEDVRPGDEDGILTAWEIACMDLRGCKLAVLSACETAQGVLDNINGVIGLQRALKLAGVQAMLLTLWPVDNELTEEFINDFYNRLPTSANFNEAFLNTQREFRKRHTDPYHWAPFMLIN